MGGGWFALGSVSCLLVLVRRVFRVGVPFRRGLLTRAARAGVGRGEGIPACAAGWSGVVGASAVGQMVQISRVMRV
jgi:hypothetical protein